MFSLKLQKREAFCLMALLVVLVVVAGGMSLGGCGGPVESSRDAVILIGDDWRLVGFDNWLEVQHRGPGSSGWEAVAIFFGGDER